MHSEALVPEPTHATLLAVSVGLPPRLGLVPMAVPRCLANPASCVRSRTCTTTHRGLQATAPAQPLPPAHPASRRKTVRTAPSLTRISVARYDLLPINAAARRLHRIRRRRPRGGAGEGKEDASDRRRRLVVRPPQGQDRLSDRRHLRRALLASGAGIHPTRGWIGSAQGLHRLRWVDSVRRHHRHPVSPGLRAMLGSSARCAALAPIRRGKAPNMSLANGTRPGNPMLAHRPQGDYDPFRIY